MAQISKTRFYFQSYMEYLFIRRNFKIYTVSFLPLPSKNITNTGQET